MEKGRITLQPALFGRKAGIGGVPTRQDFTDLYNVIGHEQDSPHEAHIFQDIQYKLLNKLGKADMELYIDLIRKRKAGKRLSDKKKTRITKLEAKALTGRRNSSLRRLSQTALQAANTCSACGRVSSTTLLSCSGCKSQRYCDKECQIKMWQQGKHKRHCKKIAQIQFLDVQQVAKMEQSDIEAPTEMDLRQVRVGNQIKVCVGRERFWVSIHQIAWPRFSGTVKNNLIHTEEHGLSYGDHVSFMWVHAFDTDVREQAG